MRCPTCSKPGLIEVEESIVNQSSRGITAINVDEFKPCRHSFVAYLDKNLVVRDCFVMDFKIELPEMATKQRLEEVDLPESDIFDVDLIKINIPALPLTYLIRAYLTGSIILFLFEGESLYRHIENFFKFLSNGTFEPHLVLGNQLQYKKNKKQFKKHVVFDSHKILNDKTKILNSKDVKVERAIIQKFLAETDTKSSLIILKNEVQKAYELSNSIVNFLENYDNSQELMPKVIYHFVSEKFGQTIKGDYLRFLIQIIQNYHGFNISNILDFNQMVYWLWYLR